MPLETLTFSSNFSFIREILAPGSTVDLGGGVQRRRRQFARPVYQFRLAGRNRIQAEMEDLYSFAVRHQGATPFWFDGGKWGALSSPVQVGVGDGVKTTFWFPNRFLLDVPLVYLDDVLASPQPDSEVTRGQLIFAAAVMADVVITARYTCRYQVLFWYEGERLLSQEAFDRQLYNTGVLLRESGLLNDETDPITLTPAYTASWEYDPFADLVEYYTTTFDY